MHRKQKSLNSFLYGIFFLYRMYNRNMERGLVMAGHSFIIGLLAFLIMRHGLGQSAIKAENRSIALTAFVLLYMVFFGHGLPTRLNPNL